MKFLDLIVAVICNSNGLSLLKSFFVLFASPGICTDSAKAIHDLQSCHMEKWIYSVYISHELSYTSVKC